MTALSGDGSQGNSHRHLAAPELLARNTLWSLLGSLSPIAAGVIAVPALITGIGADRFAVLSIAWIVLGYVGLFDLGLGRALTKLVAERLADPAETSLVPITWTCLVLLLAIGMLAGAAGCILSPWLVHKALKVPPELQKETLHGFLLLGASFPVTILTSGLRGLLEALQRFRVLTLIRIPLTVFSFGGPLLLLPFSHSIVPLFAVLVAGRVIGCFAHLIACFGAVPALRRKFVVDLRLVGDLFGFGSWITVSNLLAPAVLYFDRFLIGGLISLTAVAFYTAPFDMLTRLWLIPAALVGVLFPAFASTFKHDQEKASLLLVRGMKYILLAVFPFVLVTVTLGPQILRIWLGDAFEHNSAAALRWLAVGIFLNCLAQVPFTLIQSAGRPEVTAKLIALEFPIYWLIVWSMTVHFGIIGTAMAWTGRAAWELLFVMFYAIRLLPQPPVFILKLVFASAGGLVMLYVGSVLRGDWTKGGFLVVALSVFVLTCWQWGLKPAERSFLRAGFGGTLGKVRPH